ncbi:MAG: type II secretion system protein [Candidatus Shapirobacteria bacterium]|nr:type II secretion system protein [Candidatus Shapirobacteria bacterium]
MKHIFQTAKKIFIIIRPYSKKPAFTLIELLVVVTVFAGLGVLLVNSLFSILRSNAKSELIKEIRQNGSFALDVMTKKITSGTEPRCETSPNRISFTDVNGTEITFLCAGDHIASESGGFRVPLTSNVQLTECSFFCQSVGTASRVTISFGLSQVGAPTRQEDFAQQSFSKVILVRNQ